MNQPAKALPYIQKALITNSQQPRLLARAAVIYKANNQVDKSSALKVAALANQPLLDKDLETACKNL
ncbi:MAG: hypothetical protein EOO89_28510 [Pedobacter sp.]|nr:MAG: hypothetical protein EOO89_28510 [Pedobacter sp.]